jgi:hypothetical protein
MSQEYQGGVLIVFADEDSRERFHQLARRLSASLRGFQKMVDGMDARMVDARPDQRVRRMSEQWLEMIEIITCTYPDGYNQMEADIKSLQAMSKIK